MAATAVSELSNEPPSLLICVNQTASMYAPLSAGAPFCVNILAKGQSDLANLCSGKARGEHRFSLGDWTDSQSGVPVLRDAQASFVCINDQTITYGTHAIFIGRVIEVRTSGDVDPLIYCDHRFTEIAKAAYS